MSENENPTMREAMEKAEQDFKEAPDRDVRTAKEPREAREAAPTTTTTTDAPPPEWDGPGWSKRWKPEARDVLKTLATNPDTAEQYKNLLGQLDETHKYIGQRDQTLSQLEKTYGPVHDMLSTWNQRYQMQGMTLQQGLGQMFAVSEALAQNPDQVLPWIGNLYKPRDAAKAISEMAKAWGVDLGQVSQGQPYIDPAVQGMVSPLMNEVQQLKQALFQQQQHATEQQQSQLIHHISAVENATDASGKPLRPYFRDPQVFAGMIFAMNNGLVPRDLSQAYDWAIRYHEPAIQAKAKQAEQKALEDAAARSGVSNHAKQASNNLNSSASRGRPGSEKPSMQEAMQLAAKQLGLNQ